MPNQLNYPDPIITTANQRPERISSVDLKLIRNTQKQILFGTNVNDKVELWVYNADGTFAGHLNVAANDASLSSTTIVDTDGAHELLNIDLNAIAGTIALDPGRYAMVANFFRDEVGSETGYKLYISEISDDRTEMRLLPVASTPEVIHDIYEFLTPSVPREFAQALMAEVLGQSLDTSSETFQTQVNQFANPDLVKHALTGVIPDTADRIEYASVDTIYTNLIYIILVRIYDRSLDLMATDISNQYVQKIEFLSYISTATAMILTEMTSMKEVDPHFIFI